METGVKEGGERVCEEGILASETGQVREPVFRHVKVGLGGGSKVESFD